MQKLVRVKLSVEAYVREQFHRQMRPPSQCPNCGRFRRLWALGYYQRYTTGLLGKAIAILVRRFRCTVCRVTVICLPCFACGYGVAGGFLLVWRIMSTRSPRFRAN